MLSRERRIRVGGSAILSTFLLAAVLAACGAAASSAGPAGGGSGANPVPAAGGGDAGSGQGPGSGPLSGGSGNGNGNNANGGANAPLYAPGQEGLLIVKTGTIAIQVASIDDALNAAGRLIEGLGGYSSGSDRAGDGESSHASITYRVPAGRWDEALAGLRGLATKVLTERSSTEDVTSQVVDLGARIRNLQASETALQAIMDRAGDIEDVLRVQSELTSTRSQIEQATAQKARLEQQATFSTVTVTYSLKPNPVLVEQKGYDATTEVEAASASLVSVLQALATAGIWIVIVWFPILGALAIVGGIGLAIARRVARSREGGTPIAPAAEGGA